MKLNQSFFSGAFFTVVLVTIHSVKADLPVLNQDSPLRIHLVYKTPQMATADGKIVDIPVPKDRAKAELEQFQTTLPDPQWLTADFNDSAWERDRAPIEVGPEDNEHRFTGPGSAMICARARFIVKDPGQIKDLTLSIKYVGGVVAYLNGKEVARADLPNGELGPHTYATPYPDDLYKTDDNKFVQTFRTGINDVAGFERRYRNANDIKIPASLLRKGLNVLAFQVHRAPLNQGVLELKRIPENTGTGSVPGFWSYAALHDFELKATDGSAITPNIGRPAGIQIWNCNNWETVTAHEHGDLSELQPVVIFAPRNGIFSGRLVVGSDTPLKNLKVKMSALKSPAVAKDHPIINIRYAKGGIDSARGTPIRYDLLDSVIPSEIPVAKGGQRVDTYPTNYRHIKYVNGPQIQVKREVLNCGALAPLWFTARVPANAAAGAYSATITISADGLEATDIPLKLTVSAWQIPPPHEWRITNFGQQSPDSLALHYGVKLWSEAHFKLIGESMKLMSDLNSRVALLDLAIDFYGNPGNSESMVRWIKQADGTYTHDFTILDKYLDVVAASMPKPALVRVNCWGELRPGWGGASKDANEYWSKVREGRFVTQLDPATGALSPLEQPVPGTPESLAFWKPVLDTLRKKIESRGWWDVTAMGHNSYNAPAHPTIVSQLHAIWPDGAWSYTAHNGVRGQMWPGSSKEIKMLARYADCVWTRKWPTMRGCRAAIDPPVNYWCYTYRTDFNDQSPHQILRDVPEDLIMSGHDGISDFGVDFFPFKSDKGRRSFVKCGRGTGGPTCTTTAILSPGPDGPTTNERYEMLREGLQIGEALIYLERALKSGKLDEAITQKVNNYLDSRSRSFIERWQAGRNQRDHELILLAGDVAQVLAK